MKPACVLCFVLLCSAAYGQGKYRPGQYPVDQNPSNYGIKLHISATHFRPCATTGKISECGEGVYVDAILNGRKVELFGGVDKRQQTLIVPGDYRAMLPNKPRGGGGEVLNQSYYVLLADKSAWPCEITGFSE